MTNSLEPSLQAWLDQEDRRAADIIRKYGALIQYVGGDACTCCEAGRGDVTAASEAPFAYTVGLFGIGHPELLIVGVDPGAASGALNDVAKRVRRGRDLVPGEMLAFDHWAHRVIVEQVPNPGEIALAANRFYQRPAEYSVPLLQLTYDDDEGRFPWDDGYTNPAGVQSRPGELRA